MNTISRILAALLIVSGPVDAQESVSNIVVHIDRHDHAAPTPIHRKYLSLIRSAERGDELIMLQKYFRNRAINQAIVDAAGRGVEVRGIYHDTVDPSCDDLLPPGSSIDCSQLFFQQRLVHHKSMVLHRRNSNTTAIVGSFNLRERNLESPRVHTALSFDVEADNTFFSFYKAHAKSLRGIRTDAAAVLSLATDGGGRMSLTFHPGEHNPVSGLLANMSRCEGPLWLSYYRAAPDDIGESVFARLGDLVARGCDVRFLLDRDRDNYAAAKRLQSLGVAAHYPEEYDGSLTLGHKIVMVRASDGLHLIQSSANLDRSHHRSQNNLTLYLTGDFPAIERALNRELSRYW